MSLLSAALEAFVAVATAKSVHGAASLLHITQTAVTQRIKTLESKLTTTLFIRSRRGMLLTPEGEALLRYCHAAKELEGEALAKIKGAAITTAVTLRVTAPTSIVSARIIPQCLPIMKKFPYLLISFDINDLENRYLSLKSGESQFAVIQQEHVMPEMHYKILKPEKYLLVCTAEWKNRKLKDIVENETIVDFDPNDAMTFNYLKHYDLFHLARHERHFVNRTDSMAKMLSDGFGYGVLTEEFCRDYIERKELIVLNKHKAYENPIALAWYPRHEPPLYFSQIIQSIK